MKKRKQQVEGMAAAWAHDALDELADTIDRERDNARWLQMRRALSRVEEAIHEADCVTVAAVEAEKRLAIGEKLVSPNFAMPNKGSSNGVVTGRQLSQTKRNRARRKAYHHSGRKPGRPRIYFQGRRDGHHFYQTAGRGGKKERVY